MTDEQRVYIRGVKGRGSEVIKTLEDLGGKKPSLELGGDPSYIYFISHEGDITWMLYESEVGKIIMDFYHEIKLPEEWKDGDILFSDTDKEFAVFKDKWEFDSDKFLAYFATFHGGYLTLQAIRRRDFRLATKSEVEQFYECLHSIDKDWDAEKKQLTDWRWKPEIEHWFYFVNIDGRVKLGKHDKEADRVMFDFGNCFQNKEEAEAAAERVKKTLKGE